MVSTRQKKNQQKNKLSQLDETLNVSVDGNCVSVNTLEIEKLEQLSSVESIVLERAENSVPQNQLIENKFGDQNTKTVSSALLTVKICMHDAIFTVIENLVMPRAEMALKSITGSAGHETRSEVQNHDWRYFLGYIRDTLLMLASSRLEVDNELNRNDETRNDKDFKDGNFQTLKPKYDRTEHSYHCNFAENKLFHSFSAKSNRNIRSIEFLEEFKSVYLENLGRLELKCVYKKCNFHQFLCSFKYVITCRNLFL